MYLDAEHQHIVEKYRMRHSCCKLNVSYVTSQLCVDVQRASTNLGSTCLFICQSNHLYRAMKRYTSEAVRFFVLLLIPSSKIKEQLLKIIDLIL
jgi:hypothetical protein